jgi:hypothetical protein
VWVNETGECMTREEFYAKYGEVMVKFSSYYKFTFNYTATLPDGKTLTCGYGGNSGDIYRHEVNVDSYDMIKHLQPYTGSVDENGVEVEGFYDY